MGIKKKNMLLMKLEYHGVGKNAPCRFDSHDFQGTSDETFTRKEAKRKRFGAH